MSPSIVLVTGANTGLGFETIRAFLGSKISHTILLGGRSIEKATAAAEAARGEFPGSASTVEPIQIDIEDDASIEKCISVISEKHGRLDALVNNAGVQIDQQLYQGKMSMREMWNKSWDVNTTGTQILTYQAVPLLLKSKSPRLLFITSGTATLAGTEDLENRLSQAPEAGWPKQQLGIPAYRSSKTGLVMMAREWQRVLRNDGVKTFVISPGYLATSLGGDQNVNKQMGAGDPSLGGGFIAAVVEGDRDQDHGKVITRQGIQLY